MLYLAELFTGASTQGIYSDLEHAQHAVALHFAVHEVDYNSNNWVQISPVQWKYNTATLPEEQKGYITDVYILALELDAAIPVA